MKVLNSPAINAGLAVPSGRAAPAIEIFLLSAATLNAQEKMLVGFLPFNLGNDRVQNQNYYFGDGDNINCNYLTVLDGVAHEMGHGVTYYSSQLMWDGE